MPEEERYITPPEGAGEQPPAGEGQDAGPAPGSVPLGSPFTPEPGTETPYVAGPSTPPAQEPLPEVPLNMGTDAEGLPPAGTTPSAASAASASAGGPATGNLAGASSDDRLMSALAWISMVILQIPLLPVVLLLSETNKNQPFQRYHAINSILFWGASFVYEILAVVAYVLLSAVTVGLLALCLWPILLVPHALAIWYGVQAYQGRQSEIPIISQIARDQHWI